MKKLIFGTVILLMMSTLLMMSAQAHAQAQLQVQEQPQEIVAETLLRSTSSWNGDALPAYPEGTPEITILRFTIPPGVTLPSHLHTVINAGILLSGSLTVVSEDQEELNLKAGDTLVELVNKYHQGRNTGDEPAVIVVFYAGIEGQEVTHLKSGDRH
jgi:quercetin dioxygenase-like cupin family protein